MSLVETLTRALLYEGYILYPYRVSSYKERERFSLGVLSPATSESAGQIERAGSCTMQTECLVLATPRASVDVRVRFLQLVWRDVERLCEPQQVEAAADMRCEPVDSLDVDGQLFYTWQEAVEREVVVRGVQLDQLVGSPACHSFFFDASEEVAVLRSASGAVVGLTARRQQSIAGSVSLQALAIDDSLYRLRVTVANETPFLVGECRERDPALVRSLASAHTILTVQDGEFVSLLEPPVPLEQAAAECENIGAWPVLVGEANRRDTLLSSPIILFDYPQLASEGSAESQAAHRAEELHIVRT